MHQVPSAFPQPHPVLKKIHISQRRPWIGVFCAYLTVMMVGLPLVYLPGAKDAEILHGVWFMTVFMALFISPVTLFGLWCLLRKVEIEKNGTHLIITRCGLGVRRAKSFLLQDIRNLQAYGPIKNSAYSTQYQVLFEYHGETIPVVKRLTLARANRLIEQLVN